MPGSELREIENQLGSLPLTPFEYQLDEYEKLRNQISDLEEQIRLLKVKPSFLTEFLRPGRMVYVSCGVLYYAQNVFRWHLNVACMREKSLYENKRLIRVPVSILILYMFDMTSEHQQSVVDLTVCR